MSADIVSRWPRERAAKIRGIIDRMNICGCGSATEWIVMQECLSEAQKESKSGFCSDRHTEFIAKVLDSWGLLEHGCSIGGAWPTDDGMELLAFLSDFGTDGADIGTGKGHPEWSIEGSWSPEHPSDSDSYAEWERQMSR